MFNISFVIFILDAAKSENTVEDMTAYTSLGSAANLTVKFHMNPANNYTVQWTMGSSNSLQDTNIRDKVKDNRIKTTYFISNVTKKQLGNYTVRVINPAITNKQNEAIFSVVLKLKGTKSNALPHLSQQVLSYWPDSDFYDRVQLLTQLIIVIN